MIRKLCTPTKFSLSVGSKETRIADVNLDIEKEHQPDIVADALHLPFKDEAFERILLTDVIEHLPPRSERRALSEIFRVLVPCGELILTTPNHHVLYTYLDPAKYVIGHRHYSANMLAESLQSCGFEILLNFTSGGMWQMLSLLFYYFVVFPISKLAHRDIEFNPLRSLEDKEYDDKKRQGYTIFIKAIKKQDG